MEFTHLLALSTFALISSATPGPNNIMLMTSGANIGFARTIPHMLGIILGFTLMVLLVGLGLMKLFSAVPLLQTALQCICFIYLFYLAYKIATSSTVTNEQQGYQAMSFLAAANFQWVNPKAWSMALSAITIYSTGLDNLYATIIIAAIFAFTYLPSACLWIIAGQKLQKVLSNPANLKRFNYTMAALLIVSMLFSL
ncbi:MAG: LysE family translocator [Psychromonas sp.]|nr:LysE family translocator [Alteromonadales bacterium]MCP5077756.1 LysE family translocator [Psychromonas sp.]